MNYFTRGDTPFMRLLYTVKLVNTFDLYNLYYITIIGVYCVGERIEKYTISFFKVQIMHHRLEFFSSGISCSQSSKCFKFRHKIYRYEFNLRILFIIIFTMFSSD